MVLALAICLVILASGLMTDRPVRAQLPTGRPISPKSMAGGASWSTDSRYYVFATSISGNGIESPDPMWSKYDTQTGNTAEFNIWPLQPQLSTAERKVFKTAALIDSKSFMFSSPNGRYIVYAGNIPIGNSAAFPVMLGDRQTLQAVDTGMQIGSPFDGPQDFQVIWNDASSAFTVRPAGYMASGFASVAGFVARFDSDITQLQFQTMLPSILVLEVNG
jgi:hypothetical protein